MQTKIFGYARVSTKEQNIDRQINELIKVGIQERDIFIDKQSGKNFDRPLYIALKSQLREGDIVYVKSIDRFGRNKQQILEEWQDITKNINADIVVLDMPILDTTRYKYISGLESLITDLVLQLLSFFAEEERDRIKTRQAEGIAIAKQKGIKLGRPSTPYPKDWDKYYFEWKSNKITAVEACNRLNLKRNTFYKLANQYYLK
jgi:DNA invertase Pin-like site-specific DNA recombinase